MERVQVGRRFKRPSKESAKVKGYPQQSKQIRRVEEIRVSSLTESVKNTAGIVNTASVVLQHWSSITELPKKHKDSIFRCRRAVGRRVLPIKDIPYLRYFAH